MKIYKYFYKGKLYAFTNNKRISQIFQKTRNMKVFTKIVDTVENDSTYFTLSEQNYRNLLIENQLATYDDSLSSVKNIPVVMTEDEVDRLSDFLGIYQLFIDYDFGLIEISYPCFKNKLINALKLLEFKEVTAMIDTDYPVLSPAVKWNTFNLFVLSFNELL